MAPAISAADNEPLIDPEVRAFIFSLVSAVSNSLLDKGRIADSYSLEALVLAMMDATCLETTPWQSSRTSNAG